MSAPKAAADAALRAAGWWLAPQPEGECYGTSTWLCGDCAAWLADHPMPEEPT